MSAFFATTATGLQRGRPNCKSFTFCNNEVVLRPNLQKLRERESWKNPPFKLACDLAAGYSLVPKAVICLMMALKSSCSEGRKRVKRRSCELPQKSAKGRSCNLLYYISWHNWEKVDTTTVSFRPDEMPRKVGIWRKKYETYWLSSSSFFLGR